ncbi:redoxin domain-containing protein [Amphibacillus sp. Q70]|uniref:redoxin domain-containing protein n=1 Tax=Amphibacillus sp. Q70 TaxID=3453416 RepID=UPI003F876A96
MKRILIVTVLLGMFSWSIYEFAFQSDGGQRDDNLMEGMEQDDMKSDQTLHENGQENVTVEQTVGLEVGNRAPDFQLITLDGEEVTLSDYRGSKVMLNFWATWCPPCRAEMPDMEEFYQKTDVEILAINLTEAESHLDQVQPFVDEYQLTFPILLDEELEVAMVYDIQPIPTSFMIDSAGIIQFKTFGPLTYDQMVQALKDID